MLTDFEKMDMADYLFNLLNSPYKWGANSIYYDCSGLIMEGLKAIRSFPNVDFNCQDLYSYLAPRKNCLKVFHDYQRNDILFFGSLDHSTHVALALGPTRMLEAGGGSSGVITLSDAINKNAMVRVRDINRRRDLICGIRIINEDWSF